MAEFKGKNSLYRSLSCDTHIPNIKTPTFMITSSDDPIAKVKSVPIDEIKRNPNLLLATFNKGGHADLFMKEIDDRSNKDVHLPYVTKLAMTYFDEVDDCLYLK